MHKLSIKFETGRVFFNPNWVDLRDELIGFPKGHDDCIDSFSFAIQASEEDEPLDWDAYESVISTRKSSDYIGRV
jgi:phage terminase large subunit-like protein